ncbi:hypothetical protein [Boudabousia marimammalium]|uniref:hypothetical protein n=1 Tax=Boudabousia marimammalium TaxID=156892 RepID=UPI00094C4B97|nr:hypothetical protein [Boudabousia marimammalium]
MSDHKIAEPHPDHDHGKDCGHPAIEREDHTDFLHDGHLHHADGDHYDEHEVTEEVIAEAHVDHDHGKDCGHPAVKHGDHTDYLHDGHLHHPDGDHYDEH